LIIFHFLRKFVLLENLFRKIAIIDAMDLKYKKYKFVNTFQ